MDIFLVEIKKVKVNNGSVISDDEVLMMESHTVTFPQPLEIKDHQR